VRKADNLPPSCAAVTKSGNLNFLEPSGPLQACNGTDLLFFTFNISVYEHTSYECNCNLFCVKYWPEDDVIWVETCFRVYCSYKIHLCYKKVCPVRFLTAQCYKWLNIEENILQCTEKFK